jgi:hypothetical protein
MTLGDELDEDCQLDLTHLLKMVSGDTITAARKNQDPVFLEWPHHMWFSGNEIPAWKNKAGALIRRVVNIVFEKKVLAKHKDLKLGDKLGDEIPLIMLKCTRAYLDLANRHGQHDFWSFCPNYFKQTKKQLATMTDIMRRFMEQCGDIVIDDDGFVFEHKFHEKLYNWVQINTGQKLNFRNKNITYNGVFQELNEEWNSHIRYEKVDLLTVDGHDYPNQWVVYGIKIQEKGQDTKGEHIIEEPVEQPIPEIDNISETKKAIDPSFPRDEPKQNMAKSQTHTISKGVTSNQHLEKGPNEPSIPTVLYDTANGNKNPFDLLK